MNTHLPLSVRRVGFTLVELLVAMTVIAILVGMLTVGLTRSMAMARETSIIMEMKQLELAIEQFKATYGFYPPSFENGTNINGGSVGISSYGDLLRYVNRMSPSNQENTVFRSSGTETRLQHWYEEVGQYLDQESSLVFWLSGVCKNKTYPITGNSITPTSAEGDPPLPAHGFFPNDLNERVLFYEFKDSQLFGDNPDEIVETAKASVAGALPTQLQATATTPAFVLKYKQAYGSSNGDLFFKYRDVPTYDLTDSGSSFNSAYCKGPTVGTSPNATIPFLNPKGFQLITFGLDGKSGTPGNVLTTVTEGDRDDNICNFADGRLDKYINENSN